MVAARSGTSAKVKRGARQRHTDRKGRAGVLVTPRPYPARPEMQRTAQSHTGLRGQIITMTTKPKRPPAKAPEHERARYWRENIVNLSRRELAERIGISGITHHGL